MYGITIQGEEGQHYVVLEVIQSSSSPNERGLNVCFFRTAVGRTCFFRTSVGRKLLEILEIGNMGLVKSERQKNGPNAGAGLWRSCSYQGSEEFFLVID